jgi:hypothetical protein
MIYIMSSFRFRPGAVRDRTPAYSTRYTNYMDTRFILPD